MAARVSFYAQGLSSYGNSKGAKLKIIFSSLKLVYGKPVLRMRKNFLPFFAGTHDEQNGNHNF